MRPNNLSIYCFNGTVGVTVDVIGRAAAGLVPADSSATLFPVRANGNPATVTLDKQQIPLKWEIINTASSGDLFVAPVAAHLPDAANIFTTPVLPIMPGWLILKPGQSWSMDLREIDQQVGGDYEVQPITAKITGLAISGTTGVTYSGTVLTAYVDFA